MTDRFFILGLGQSIDMISVSRPLRDVLTSRLVSISSYFVSLVATFRAGGAESHLIQCVCTAWHC